MPPSLDIHQPLLVNTIGHAAGVAIFGYLLALLWLDLRGRRADGPVLPAVAALLALIWNAGALLALASSSSTMGGALAHDLPAAAGFAALSVLPAVLLDISLQGGSPLCRRAGWIISGIAVGLHFAELHVDQAKLHQAALGLISAGFAALSLWQAFFSSRLRPRQSFSRVLAPMALFLFAVSFVHFGELGEAVWSRELAFHHAGIPLAIYIVLQDYRFLLADAFVRSLATGVLAGALTLAAIVANERWRWLESAAANSFNAGLLVVAACLALLAFSALRSWCERWLMRRVFQRDDVDALLRDMAEMELPDSEPRLIREAAERIASYAGTERFELRGGAPTAMFMPQLWRMADDPWVEAAAPLRFAHGDSALLLLGRRSGGRRYLSGDLAALSQLGLAAVALVERFRSRERDRLAAEAELRALQAQINPHFLFNALNAL